MSKVTGHVVCTCMLRSLSFITLAASYRRAVLYPSSWTTCSRSFSTNVVALASGQVPTSRHQVLTLLHKTTSLLPRTLARAENAAHPCESLEFWNEILAVTYDNLTRTQERNTRIVIYGVDKWSGAQEVVTALLDEPFNSDSQNTLIKNRWKGYDLQSLTIEHVASATETDTVRTSSSFLTQFAMPVEITEINTPSFSNSPILSDKGAISILFKADVSVVVCNLLTTPLTDLLASTVTLNNPNTILIFTSSSTTQVHDHIKSIVQKHLDQPKIIFVDPWRALHALEVLRSDPTSPPAVQCFQDDFIGSRITTTADALKEIFVRVDCTPTVTSPKSCAIVFQTYTALAQIRGALATCNKSLQLAEREIDTVCTGVSNLRGQIEEAKMKVCREILGVSALEEFEVLDEVGKALSKAEKKIRVALDWLTWWRIPWRVDEIGIIMGDAVDRAWCKGLEKKLILHTGRLIALQQSFTSSTFALFSSHPPTSPFSSPLLLNSLQQLSSSPSYPLTPSTLTAPLHIRRTQLKYPTTRLHLAGQKATLGMGGGIVAGIGIGCAVPMGLLTVSAEGVLGFLGMEAGTAVAVGMLSALLSVRWAIGTWERAKRRWLEDWRRVGDGLARDLKMTLDRTMRNNVVVVAEHASLGLEDWTAKRKEEVQEVREELLKLEDGIDEVQRRIQR